MLNKLISAPTWGAFLFSETERRIINHGKNQLLPNLVRRNPLYESTHQINAFEHRCKARAKPLSGSPAASQDGQTIKELAYRLCVKPSNFKPIAQPLEERGLIERRQDENDKRSFRIYLTEKGRAESAAIDAEFSALFEENPDAAELQQQVIEGFEAFRKLASLNSQLKTIPTDPHTRKEN